MRINVESSIYKDPRFHNLLIKLGSRLLAKGAILDAWELAQQNWLKHRCIPAKAWPKDLDILIEVELAERLEDGSVYVKGSKKEFLWIDQKSKAGKKLSEKKRDQLKNARNAKSNICVPALNGSERNLNGSERNSSASNGSEALSLSLTLSQKELVFNKLNTSPKSETTSPKSDPVPIPEFQEHPDLADFVKKHKISSQTQQNWLKLYQIGFLCSEIVKAEIWLENNPRRKPKPGRGVTMFFSNWFDRGFERFRKSQPTRQVQQQEFVVRE